MRNKKNYIMLCVNYTQPMCYINITYNCKKINNMEASFANFIGFRDFPASS